ncbi:MAG: heavy metal-binding domain-containing protein [Alphaproteobacteria bacterium]|nr:heavy metal-binding domain-containing protein [Alphaproteobacteria bacterium]
MIVTTMDGVAGRMTQETLGVVRGSSMWTRRIIKSSFGGIRNFRETGSADLDAGLNQAKEDANRTMLEQAVTLGADAIIGVRIDVTEMSNGVFCVSATGTAVKTVMLPASVPAYPVTAAADDNMDFDWSFLAARPSFAGSALRH